MTLQQLIECELGVISQVIADDIWMCFVFFFKQKTAYEISACLVGSEMCIRDSSGLLGYLCVALAVLELTL